MHVIRAAGVTPQRAQRPIFTGEVHAHTFVDETIGDHLRVTLVKFSPGARTTWHTHAFEQGLIIVEGHGIVATEHEEFEVDPGDIVIVPAGEKHWHGGAERTAMAHYSITTPGETTVMEPVERG